MEDSLHLNIGQERADGSVYIDKKTLAFLDFLSNYQWDRPIHFGIGGNGNPRNNMFCLQDYLVMEGLTYKLVPLKLGNLKANDARRSYDIITENWEYGGMDNPDTYLTEADKRTSYHLRSALNAASISMLMDGDTLRARELINLSADKMPLNCFEPDITIMETIETVYGTGQQEKGDSLASYMFDQLEKDIIYLYSFPDKHKTGVYRDALHSLSQYDALIEKVAPYNRELAEKKREYFERLYTTYTSVFPFVVRN